MVVLGVVLMLVLQMMGYHESHLPWMPQSGIDFEEVKAWEPPSPWLLGFYYLMPYLKLWALIGGVACHVILLRALPHVEKLIWPAWVACGFLALWAVCDDLRDQLEFARLSMMGEPASVASYVFKLAMIVLVCLMPAVGVSFYARCSLLERYTVRAFVQPLFFCFAGICLLWMMWDMLDSLRDFQEARAPIGRVIGFYLSLVPYIFVETMWAVLLLSTLFTFTRLSRTNELISMLGTGRSLGQIMRPVFIVTGMIAALCLAANYYWAPRAEGNRQAVMRALDDEGEGATMTEALMYRDEPNRRTWFIGSFPFNLRDEKIKRVEVVTEDEKGQIIQSIRAQSAFWWADGMWTFYHGIEQKYKDGKPDTQYRFGKSDEMARLDLSGWPETPWSIVSSSLRPDFMSVQELVSYLKAHGALAQEKLAAFRTAFFHRFAYPLQCLVAVLVAAPLGVSFSRRGVLGGIAGAILALIGLVFLNQLFVTLGKSLRVAPWLTVWMPHLIVGAAGLVLFWFRARNRDLPRPSLAWLTAPSRRGKQARVKK